MTCQSDENCEIFPVVVHLVLIVLIIIIQFFMTFSVSLFYILDDLKLVDLMI